MAQPDRTTLSPNCSLPALKTPDTLTHFHYCQSISLSLMGKLICRTYAALNNFSIFLGEHFDLRMHVYSKNNKIMAFFMGNLQTGSTSRCPPRLRVDFSKVHEALK